MRSFYQHIFDSHQIVKSIFFSKLWPIPEIEQTWINLPIFTDYQFAVTIWTSIQIKVYGRGIKLFFIYLSYRCFTLQKTIVYSPMCSGEWSFTPQMYGYTFEGEQLCHFHFYCTFQKNMLPREVNKKSQKLFPFLKIVEKNVSMLIHFKLLYLRWSGSTAAVPVTNITDINNFCKYSYTVTVHD